MKSIIYVPLLNKMNEQHQFDGKKLKQSL